MPKFNFNERVKNKLNGYEFFVKAIMKSGNLFLYLQGQLWIPESEIEKVERPLFKMPSPSDKLFAYGNFRTGKIDHYEHEWAGNQFSKRCPQYDIPRVQ